MVKLPSARYKAVPENEFAMVELARRVGVAVPDNKLVDIAGIKGLPEQAHMVEGKALAVKRFHRLPDGKPVHIEDFAQVFGEYPNNKYKFHSYANIANVLGGNRRARHTRIRSPPSLFRCHRQRRHAPQELVPPLPRPAHGSTVAGYDFVATLPYIPNDKLGLLTG